MEKVIIVIVVLLVGLVLLTKRGKGLFVKRKVGQLGNGGKMTLVNNFTDDLQVHFEMLPVTHEIDESKLVIIKDSKVLAQINHLVPKVFQSATTGSTALLGNTKDLYQVIIPAGETLAKSNDMLGAVRGFYPGAKGIGGHANLIRADNVANITANAVASTMGVASMIVGQYYMEQINTKLTTISEDILGIADFQDNEYKSRVFALITQIKKMASFQVEILENDELRTGEIANLNSLEQQCIELLGQANVTIAGFLKKENLTFDEYEKKLVEVQKWCIYQKTLIDVLCRIADLKHILHLGSVSRKQCEALLSIYSTQVKDVISQLNIWHQLQTERFDINIDTNLRKRAGFDGFVHKLPGLVNKSYNFRSISDQTMAMITAQVMDYEIPRKKETVDLFRENVRLIAKGETFYYLPENDL